LCQWRRIGGRCDEFVGAASRFARCHPAAPTPGTTARFRNTVGLHGSFSSPPGAELRAKSRIGGCRARFVWESCDIDIAAGSFAARTNSGRRRMRVARIRTADELAALAPEWNCLAGGIPFRRHEWMATWQRCYGGELFVVAVRTSSGALVGIAPWYVDRSLPNGRVVRFLGSGEACSDYLGILATPEFAAPAVDAVADYLCGSAADAWDSIELEGVDADEPTIRRLVAAVQQRDALVVERPGLNCWRLALPESWEAYLAGVSKSHRKQLRRIETRLLDTNRATLHSVRTEAELPAAWPTFVDLHQRRRAALGEKGCFASPRFAAFHEEVARRFAANGALRLDLLQMDGKPAAAEYHFAGGGVAFAYQAGVAPELMEEEPGRTITVALIRRAIEDGLSAIDFLRGDEPYKAHFRAVARPTTVVRIVAPRAAARWRHRAWLAGTALKGAVKRGLTLAGAAADKTGKAH
jgi:CelD/BcsL family acetyltransferase involved in cellulose biosynthesis